MDLELTQLVMLLLLGSMVGIGVVSLASRLMHQKAERRLTASRTVCRSCGHVYQTREGGRVGTCPGCGELNLHRKNGPLG